MNLDGIGQAVGGTQDQHVVCATNSGEATAPASLGDFLRPASSKSATTRCAPLRARSSATSRPIPLAPPIIRADLTAELCFSRHALQLGLFEGPILNPECFGAGQGHVVVKVRELLRLFRTPCLRQRMSDVAVLQGVRSCHHMDGVDEELGGDPRLFLVFAKAEEAEPGTMTTEGLESRSLGESLEAHSS